MVRSTFLIQLIYYIISLPEFKQTTIFNDELNAEAYFRETEEFHKLFGCDFSKQNVTELEKKKRIERFNEFF